MILGVGLDVVDVDAFGAQLADAASGFVEATFRPGERRAGPSTPGARRAQHLAGRFAAKEALVKAWSSARRGQPPALPSVDLRDIEVVDDGYGRPALRLHGSVASAVRALAPSSTSVVAHLSISHDGHVAAAVVVLELVEGGDDRGDHAAAGHEDAEPDG